MPHEIGKNLSSVRHWLMNKLLLLYLKLHELYNVIIRWEKIKIDN